MDFLKRNIQKTLRNGNQIITKVTAVSSIGSGNSTLTGNYLPATANEDGTYTVDLTKVTFNGHIVATGEVSAYGAGSGTTPSGGSITVIDNLTSTDANAALSANQGRALKELIDNIDISGLDLSGYYNKTEIDNLLSGHTSNTTVHITATERTNWNDANSKKHIHTNKTVLDNLTQSVIDNSHTHSNKSVLDGITSTKVSNWDSAATNKHTHSNKSVLDGITATKVSNWDTVYSNWNTAFYFDNSGNLRAKVNVIGEQEVSAYGEGESGGSGLVTVVDNLTSTSIDAALSANMGRYLKSLIDNIDISELDLSGLVTLATAQTITGAKTFSGSIAFTKNVDASGTSDDASAPVRIGNPTSQHLTFDSNEIMSKSSATEVSALYLNNEGGVVYINGKVALHAGNFDTYAAAKTHTHTFSQISDASTYIYDASLSRTKNTVLAAPNGSNGKATFRALVAADIPSLAISKITNLQTTLDAKAAASDLTSHTGNTTVHITSAERTNWNAAYSNNHTHSNKTVIDGITSTLVSHWNTAYTNNHTHSNKSVLDGITAAKVTAWDTVVSNWNTAFTIDSNNNLKVKLNLIGEKEVSAYGAGSSSGSGAITIVDALTSSATDAALSANQGRVLKSMIDNIDISALDTSNFVTLNNAQTITALKTFTGGIVSSWLTVRHTTDTSQCKGLGWQNTSGSTVASINYHNTAQNIIINPIGSADVWTDAVGKYSLFVGNNKLTYNTYPILTSHNYTDYIKYWDTTISRTANTVLAAPSGSNGTASFRKLNASDLLTGEGSSDFTDGTELLSSYANDSGFASTAAVNNIYRRKASSMWNYIKSKITADTSLTVALASGLAYKTLNGDAVDSTAGTFAFGGNSYSEWSGTDYAGLQVSGYNDKFQIAANNGNLVFRQNDNGGANTSWNDWKTLAFTTSNVSSATKLNTARSLWGNSFDGSADIDGQIKSSYGGNGTFIGGVSNAALTCNYTGTYCAILNAPTKNGRISLSTYKNSNDYVYLGYASQTKITNATNSFDHQLRWNGENGQLLSDAETGTAPFHITSTTLNTNLNADLLDGVHANGLFTALSQSGDNLSITIGGTTKTLKYNAPQLNRYIHTRISTTTGGWYKIFTVTIGARYAYGSANFMLTDLGKPTSGDSRQSHIVCHFQQQNAFGSKPFVNLYILDGNCSTLYLKGVYTLNSDSTTIDIYTCASYTYMRPMVSNIGTYVSNGSWEYPTGDVVDAPTFNIDSEYQTQMQSSNFNSTVYSKFNYFRNNANNDNAGYVGAGSTGNNNIALMAYSGNNLILGANGSSVLTLDGSTVASTQNIELTNSDPHFRAYNTNGSIELLASTNRGVYDRTNSRWLITTDGTNTWLACGNVGIGTTAPSYKLHVNGSVYCTTLTHANNVYQYWKDSEGENIAIHSLSSANNFWLGYGLCPKNYQLRIGGGSIQFYSGTDRTSRMFLSSAGNFGIGTTSPSQKLHVSGNILATGEITAYSDIRLKKNIKPLQVRGELKPVTYEKDGKKGIGFIAQDVQKIYPELVTEEKTDEKYLSLNYAQLTAVLYAEIIELKRRIKQLENKQ